MTRRNENRRGYKKTKVGWIPEEWECVQLRKLGDGKRPAIKAGPFGSSLKKEYYVDNGYKIYGQEQVIAGNPYLGNYFINEKRLCSLRSCEVFPGDILLSLVGTIGKALLIPPNYQKGIINPRLLRISLNKNRTSSLYAKYFLEAEHTFRLLNSWAQGGTMGVLNAQIVRSLPIPLPPLSEQKKIAEILSAWDRAIALTDWLIDAKQRFKKGLMQQLLTGRMRFPEFGKPVQKKGELPVRWKIKRLGSFGSFLKGKGISNSEKTETGIPCITYGEIYTRHEFVIKDFYSFIDRSITQKSQRIKRNDILFAGSGETLDEIGKCVVHTKEIEAYAGGDIVIFRPKGVNPLYLSYSLNSDLLIRQKIQLGQGHSVVHIYSAGLKTLQVSLPSLDEQTRIATVLSACDREIELLHKKEIALREQKKGLMQKLLTGEVRIKLNEGD